MSDGCEQRERFPLALGDGHFRADETGFEGQVAMSADLASRLRFVDLQHSEVGTWGELFDTDEALVMARIAGADLSAPQADFVRDAEAAPLAALAHQVVALARWVDGWLKSLRMGEQPAARSLCARIEQLVAQPLADDLHWVLERFGAQPWLGVAPEQVRSQFDSVWFGLRSLRVEPAQRSDRDMLRGRFFSFVSAIERLQDRARELLPQSLTSQAHAPAAGLLMTFLQLHQLVQKRINRFTDRHADFYHDDCLRMRPLPVVPDSIHLVFERDPRAAREVVVPRGTSFTAGKDALGRPVEFLADDDLLVTGCRVAALLTVRLVRDALISPEREFGYVTRAVAARLPWPAPPIDTVDAAPPHWPLFGGGASPAAHGLPGASEEAQLGLAIASPLLFLREGEREITLTLQLGHAVEADHRLRHLVSRIHAGGSVARRLLPVLFKRYLLLAPELLSLDELGDLNAAATDLAGSALERQRLAPPAGVAPGCREMFLIELAVRAPTRDLFFARLGKVFSRWLLTQGDWLTDDALAALRATASRLLDERDRPPPVAGDPRCLLQGPHRPERELIFGQLFNGILGFSLTGPAGWMPANDFFVTAADAGGGTHVGLGMVIRLRPQDPSVVGCDTAMHGAGWPTGLPVLRIQLRTHGRLYPYSLLEEMLLTEATLAVRVRGLRDVVLSNNLGRLDASKPFMPFGPLPTTASYCVFGAPEIARKNITRLSLNIEWSGLPVDDGGFGDYYGSYGPGYRNEAFTVSLGILRDGQWQNAGPAGGAALFESIDAAGRLCPRTRLVIGESALRAHGRATTEPLDFKLGARNGFYRVQLHGPATAFGHQAYPGLLTEVVSANTLRRRRQPLPLPNAPYTPLIDNLSIDYEAQSHLVPGRDAMADDDGADTERLLHLHPFGLSQVHPGAAGASPSLWPRFQHDGNLYIGLAGDDELSGALTLHFHLRDEAAVESLSDEPRPRTSWAYLASNVWRPLAPSQVVADTTCGFLTSGIVTLDLPAQIDRLSTILPADCHWLRLSVDSGFDTFAGLYGVRTQAVRASRVIREGAAPLAGALPAGSVKEPSVTVFGLGSVAQVGPSFGLRAAEDRRQMRTRIGERLQHKQRASTPWDIERLVLERFPSVLKAKCFPHLSVHAPEGASPGDVLVVVVPLPPTAPGPSDAAAPLLSATAEPHLNAVELERIRDFLQGLASPFARIRVRNAVYERIQVRCTVKLCRGVQAGQALRRIDQAITEYISPWREGGCRPSFDWTVRCEDVEAHVRSLDCVDFVTQLSLLHVAQSDSRVYTLGDTARGQAELATRARPGSPWSIALPMREHMVRTVDTSTDERPEMTGIARLGIGSTFIVGGTSP